MIVYFEDGPIKHKDLCFSCRVMLKVDAGEGYSNCRKKLKEIRDNYPFDTRVYTNSLDAFSNFWCWDDKKKIPMIYVKDKNCQWKLISELTTRKLRIGHNLEKLYVNGVFGDVEN